MSPMTYLQTLYMSMKAKGFTTQNEGQSILWCDGYDLMVRRGYCQVHAIHKIYLVQHQTPRFYANLSENALTFHIHRV